MELDKVGGKRRGSFSACHGAPVVFEGVTIGLLAFAFSSAKILRLNLLKVLINFCVYVTCC